MNNFKSVITLMAELVCGKRIHRIDCSPTVYHQLGAVGLKTYTKPDGQPYFKPTPLESIIKDFNLYGVYVKPEPKYLERIEDLSEDVHEVKIGFPDVAGGLAIFRIDCGVWRIVQYQAIELALLAGRKVEIVE